MILRIASKPARNYYSTPEDRALIQSGEAAHQWLTFPGTLRSSAGGEVANLSPFLNQAALTHMRDRPPLGALATLTDGATVLHSGRVVSITWAPDGLGLEIQP